MTNPAPAPTEERLRRWRLALGTDENADGERGEMPGVSLSDEDAQLDRVLASLYDSKERRGSLGRSQPNVQRWLGDIRTYFPASVVRVMQQDAMDRLGLRQMLLEPEMLEAVDADVHLVATLMSLRSVIPAKTRETARQVVRKVVADVERKLRERLIQAVRGGLNRATRTSRPKSSEIDWHRTIHANLQHYSPANKTIVPEKLIGYGRRRPALRDVIVCIDQSGSMAPSVVYASILGCVLASIRSLKTRLIVFDTAVVDLTDQLADPVDVLFGTQLGGGTDINRALAYCQQYVTRPNDTIFVLITDLCEGGDAAEMLGRAHALKTAGVNLICLLSLSDDGTPAHDDRHAAAFATMGIPTFGCTPDLFPDLISAALARKDLTLWANTSGLIARSNT